MLPAVQRSASAVYALGRDALTKLFREFWPDIATPMLIATLSLVMIVGRPQRFSLISEVGDFGSRCDHRVEAVESEGWRNPT